MAKTKKTKARRRRSVAPATKAKKTSPKVVAKPAPVAPKKKARREALDKTSLGITQFELFMMIPAARKRIYRLINKTEKSIMVSSTVRVAAEIIEKLGKKANKVWRPVFATQANALNQLAYALDKGGVKMRKIELGITPKELMAELPMMIASIWPHYNDDQKITADEGLIIAAIVLEGLANPCDDPYIKEFFDSQAAALRGLAPLFEPEEEPEPAPPVSE
jgi:hypothetical protein